MTKPKPFSSLYQLNGQRTGSSKGGYKRPTFKTTYEYDLKSRGGHAVLSKVLFQRSY